MKGGRIMPRIFVKGDFHGQFGGLKDFCKKAETTTEDILIVLGDFSVNYSLDVNDFYLKRSLAKLPITFVAVHGNHEERPYNVPGYKLVPSPFGAGNVWFDERFPNQFFFDDGEYTLGDKTALVIGGAYSVDKNYRLMSGNKWFESEQISDEMKAKLLQETAGKHYDYILAHTCPTNYIPRDMFLSMINQDEVDRSTEDFLQKIIDQTTFDKFFCGHWHTDRIVDKIRFVFHDYLEVGNDY